MIGLFEEKQAAAKDSAKAPASYQEWLDCLELLKGNEVYSLGVYDALSAGTFSGTEAICASLQRRIADSVNAFLGNSGRRFVRNINECFEYGEFSRIDMHFGRLKNDVRVSLFFERLEFLPEKFRKELSAAIREQMTKLWNDTLEFIREQPQNSDTEDALFLIGRVKLFE